MDSAKQHGSQRLVISAQEPSGRTGSGQVREMGCFAVRIYQGALEPVPDGFWPRSPRHVGGLQANYQGVWRDLTSFPAPPSLFSKFALGGRWWGWIPAPEGLLGDRG